MAATKAQIHTLVTYFLNGFKNKYDTTPKDFNRFRDQWGFQGMIDDYGMETAKLIIDYYFSTARHYHPTSYLLYNYEKLNSAMLEREEDEKKRAALRAESKRRVEEWRAQYEQ